MLQVVASSFVFLVIDNYKGRRKNKSTRSGNMEGATLKSGQLKKRPCTWWITRQPPEDPKSRILNGLQKVNCLLNKIKRYL
jgi:hypothetical protein